MQFASSQAVVQFIIALLIQTSDSVSISSIVKSHIKKRPNISAQSYAIFLIMAHKEINIETEDLDLLIDLAKSDQHYLELAQILLSTAALSADNQKLIETKIKDTVWTNAQKVHLLRPLLLRMTSFAFTLAKDTL